LELDERIVANLMRLGLTKYEALAYIALVQLGSGTVAEIHRLSGVPTTKLYDVLSRLESRGWVEVLRERPLRYRARPPEEVLDMAIEDVVKACEDAKTALKELYGRGREVEKSDVWMVRGFKNVEKRMISMMKSAKESIHLALSKLASDFLEKVKEILINAYWKGVDVRVMVAELEEKPDLGGIEVVVLRPPLVMPEVTIVYSLVVMDRVELLLALPIGMSRGRLRDVVGVWVRDRSLAELAAEYSILMMRTAKKLGLGGVGP